MAKFTKAGRTADESRDVIDQVRSKRAADSYVTAAEAVEMATGFGGEAKVYLARRQESGDWAHMIVLLASEFDLEKIRERWGGGHFRMQVRGTREDGTKGWVDGCVFDIEGPPLLPKGPAVAAPVAPDKGDGSGDLLKIMFQMQQQQLATLTDIVKAAVGARPEPAAAKAADSNEVIRLAKEIAQLSAPAAAVQDPMVMFDRWVTTYNKGVAAGRELAEGVEPPDPMEQLVKDVAIPLAQHITGKRPAAVNPGEVPPAALPPATGPAWLQALGPYWPVLANLANVNTSADVVVDLVLDRLPQSTLDEMATAAESEGWVDATHAALPGQLRDRWPDWCRAVLVALRRELTEPDEPAS